MHTRCQAHPNPDPDPDPDPDPAPPPPPHPAPHPAAAAWPSLAAAATTGRGHGRSCEGEGPRLRVEGRKIKRAIAYTLRVVHEFIHYTRKPAERRCMNNTRPPSRRTARGRTRQGRGSRGVLDWIRTLYTNAIALYASGCRRVRAHVITNERLQFSFRSCFVLLTLLLPIPP